MDRLSVRQRSRSHPVPCSTAIQLRYERDRLELQKRVTEQLVSDVFGLYEKSLFVDLKLEASRGSIYCHQLFFAARVPGVWRLLREISKFQRPAGGPHNNLLSIQLPNLECQELQKFTRTLYDDKLNRAAGLDLKRKLEDTLATLQQRALISHKKLHIERLSTEEEQHIQQIILEQLRLGQLSERRGNIQDLERFINPRDPRCTCYKNVSDTDSSTCNTVKLKPKSRGRSPVTAVSVRPKSSQRIHVQIRKPLGNTMNIADPSVVDIGNCEARGRQPVVEKKEVSGDTCDSNLDNVYASSSNLSQKGKKALKPLSPNKRSSGDDLSPVGQLSKQESPVFNVSMIKELQTSPMQVSGETFQDKLRERQDYSPPKASKAKNSISTPVETLIKEAEQKCGLVSVNGESSPFILERVKVKKPSKYSAMSNSKEKPSLHQATNATKYHSIPAQSASTSKTSQQQKSQSFGAESQDSGDFDTASVSVSNSGSDQRLSHLHETSSLEVELPSSHEDNSSSHDSDEGLAVLPLQVNVIRSTSEVSRGSPDGNQIEVDVDSLVDDESGPKRPLVRARTFEVFHPLVDGVSSESPTSSFKPEKVKVEKEQTPESDVSSRSVSTHHVTFISSKKSESNPREPRSVDNGKERKISDESVSLYQDSVEDPEKLREIERKKGSLLFEHNFQTYSNIPTTNMMTASLMTASISSESSMGVGSLYSSMMDSAMLGSIHSLGGLDVPVVDPIPRPASVGLPVIHTLEEPSCAPHVIVNHPVLKGQKSTEQMALELQREIARRGQGTRSPSPDSLCVDLVAKRELDTSQRGKAVPEQSFEVMENSSSSINKEEMDDEEKEKDDRENESKSSESSNSEAKGDSKAGARGESIYTSLTNITGSPRLARAVSENTPIVSGGSTLKREKESGDTASVSKCDRQVSVGSVKDVDSIPLVFGYIGPQDEDGKKEAKEVKEPGTGEDEDKQQSIFSMFIDFNEIPTPSTEEAKEDKKLSSKAKAQSSGVYMYIEADTPSPKTRRKRKSESDGAVSTQLAESQPEDGHSSLPPVLPDASKSQKVNIIKSSSKGENNGGSDDGGSKEKKGFFMFIEAETSSKTGSPKPKRRQAPPPKKKPEVCNVMTRSAPSDSLVFSSPESSSKLMTKSVIDRDEFIAQPPTRKNVSLNDKINESSNSKDSSFVSGIPRPIHSLKSKSPNLKTNKVKGQHKQETSSQRESSVSRTKDDQPSEANDMATSKDISISELGPSQSISLSEVMSTSLPKEAEISEVSDVSSLLSSIERSNEPSDQGGTESCSQLGEDLLRMFLNEINTDVTIQIGEKRIRAHKCILASRCVYFAAMLSGHWVESAGNVIKLQGFSADSVMVALKHIYSGCSTVPEGVRVGELAALADMLALDGLKDVISLHLKAKMCHYFHKPCSGCLEGVLDVLPISGAYCLDELYHRCLRWVAKHFVVVLPTRNYAALPPEVQDRCLKQLIDDMSVSNVIETALGCERVLSSLPMVRWAQPVFESAAQLLESATSFIAANLSGVLASDRFIALGKDSGWSIDSLEDTMHVACELVRPDQAVLSHVQLTKLLEQSHDEGVPEFSETFISFLENLLNQVEKFMVHNANRVAVCRKWPLLPTSTQRRIKDAALVVVEFSRPVGSRPRLSSVNRRTRGSSSDSSGTPGRGDQRLMRSASATAVPSSQRTTPRRPPLSGQNPTRCQTPPANLSRLRTQTPPPTRASTLRAQARQAAIQRSQSARTVAERPCRPKQANNDTSTDEDTQSSNKRAAPVGTFTRGATFTRSLSRPSPGCPRPQTPNSAQGPSTSRPRTPASSEPSQPAKRAAPLQRTPSHTFARTQSADLRSRTPTRRSEVRGTITSNLRSTRSQREVQSSAPNLTETSSPTSHVPKTEKIEPRKQVDARNGNIIARSRSAVMGRAARSPMRESGRNHGMMSGRGTSPSSSRTLTSSATDLRSRSCSVANKKIDSTATPPMVGSRSNTFSKDGSASNRKSIVP
ncbi:serine-rich adhesin for platelets isoform X2 [Macrobrachium rosenbergii]|uniref:serine-rich adhesin for platelets isoform X2 n=2 Tax=Macrobrachium rosenbergii TaxID=79674 RepID=UPI0034D56759